MKNPRSLYEINAEINLLTEDILNTSDWTEQTELLDQLDNLEMERDEKREAYIHVIRNAESMAEDLQRESKGFALRAGQHRNLAARLKKRLLEDLQQHGEQTASAGNWKLRRQKNPVRVEVYLDVEELPEEFQRVKVEIDKSALLEALKRGADIKGVALKQDEHIRIAIV